MCVLAGRAIWIDISRPPDLGSHPVDTHCCKQKMKKWRSPRKRGRSGVGHQGLRGQHWVLGCLGFLLQPQPTQVSTVIRVSS